MQRPRRRGAEENAEKEIDIIFARALVVDCSMQPRRREEREEQTRRNSFCNFLFASSFATFAPSRLHLYLGLPTQPRTQLRSIDLHRIGRAIFAASSHGDQLSGDADGDFVDCHRADFKTDGGVNAQEFVL